MLTKFIEKYTSIHDIDFTIQSVLVLHLFGILDVNVFP